MIVNPGIRRFLGSAIQRLFNGASFSAPLTHSAIPTRAASGTTATFTRATTKTWPNNDGYMVTGVAGEIGFPGARRVRNLLTFTEDFSNAAWLKYRMTISASAINSPISGVMYKTSDSDSAADRHFVYQNVTTVSGNQYVGSVVALAGELSFLRLSYLNSGLTTLKCGVFNLSTGLAGAVDAGITQNITSLGGGFYRCSIAFTASDSGGLARFQIEGIASNTTAVIAGSSSQGIYTGNAQLEDVTAQTTQTAGEYVSVGVESAPYYHGSFVDGVKCYATDINGSPIPSSTLLGYQAQGARTNLCLQSNAFTTTWTDIFGSCAATQNVIGPDGATSAWTLTDDNAAGTEGKIQTITLTAAAYTLSVRIKKTTGAQGNYPVIYAYTGAATPIALATIDTSNGAATAWTSFTGSAIASGVSARCSSFNTDYWLAELTFTATAAVWTVGLVPATTSVATYAGPDFTAALTGSAVFYGAQVELGSFASSYIPTTTIAVARNADVLTYSSAGNILGTAGWAYAEVTYPRTTTTASPRVIDTGSLNGIPLYLTSSTRKVALYDGTAAREGAALTLPTSSPVKIGSAWGGASSVIALSGVATAAGFDGSMTTTSIQIGVDTGNVDNELNGTIRNVRIGQRQLSASELGAITS